MKPLSSLFRQSVYFPLLFLLAFACQRSLPSEGTMRIATLRGPSGMSMAPMMRRDAGDSLVEFMLYDDPLRVRALMIREEVEVAVLPSTFGALMYNRGVPYQVAAVPVWGNLYLLGPAGETWEWENARGKRIHLMARGMTPDILFRYLARINGLDPSTDLILDYSFPGHIDLAQAVAAGQARYGIVAEPQVSMVLEKNPSLARLLDLNLSWAASRTDSLEIPQTAILVHADFAHRHPGKIAGFLESYRQAANWVVANPEDAGRLIDSLGIMKGASLAARSIPWSNIRYRDVAEVQDGLFDYFSVFYEFDPMILGGKMPDEDFVYKK